MNHVILSGVVERVFSNEKSVALKIKTTETFAEKQYDSYHDIVVFGRLIESASRLAPGDQVMAIGRLQTRKVETKSGTTEYRTNVVCNQLTRSVDLNDVQF